MVLLKSLQCCICNNRCHPDFGYPGNYLATQCDECKNEIFCGECDPEVEQCIQTGKKACGSDIINGDVLAYFDRFAPTEEMKLLSLRRWSPLFCRTCSATQRVAENGEIFCSLCDPSFCEPAKCKKLTDFIHTRILLELNELLLLDERKAITPKEVTLQCEVCSECRAPCRTAYVTNGGRLVCSNFACYYRNQNDYILDIECIFYFETFRRHIPDLDDLRALTYSKWTPLKCVECSVVFSEVEERMPMLHKTWRQINCQKCAESNDPEESEFGFIKFHFLLDIIKEFRQYFKNNGIDCVSNKSYHEDKLIRTASQPTRRTSIPDTLGCQCGRHEATEKMKNCSTCHINALCPYCLVQDHWTHQITDTLPELLVEVVNKESDKIKGKLKKWSVRLELTQKKGKEAFGNLVSTYETMFLKALESKSPDELSELIQLLDNFSDVEDLLMDSMTDIFEKLVKIDDVCAELRKFTH